MTKHVYTFGKGKADGSAQMKDLLGGKGAGLAEIARLGLPVPPGFSITTSVCRHYLGNDLNYPDGLKSQVEEGMRHIEKIMGSLFGDPKNPLLVSVRSGAATSMPGMMETILNLGLNDETVAGLIQRTDNPRFGYDSYRRLIQMYGDVVMGIPSEIFEQKLHELKEQRGVKSDVELTAIDLEQLIEEFREVIRKERHQPFPQDPKEQLWGAIGAVFGSWNTRRAIEYRRIHNLSAAGGTACNVQAMVYGNKGNNCGTGVAFTRDPATGAKRFFGEFLLNAQGEDVVAGIRTPQPINREGGNESLEEVMPNCYAEFVKLYQKLEQHYRDMQDIEFTIEEGRLWLLQTRTGKRTGKAAVKIAVDMVSEGLITKEEAVLRVNPLQIEQLLHPTLDPNAKTAPVAMGLAASPGGAVGRIVFSADAAVTWCQNGEQVILVRQETSPDDIHGMHVAQGFITARGGLTSHAAVVARGMGKPCVVGCEVARIDANAKELRFVNTGDRQPLPANGVVAGATGDCVFKEGDWLTIDGSTGAVIPGKISMTQPELVGEFGTLMGWADAVRVLRVRANADTPGDAEISRKFGAEGIGLCRTEHMFFDPERISVVRQMILAEDADARKKTLARLLPMQKGDFKGILKAMTGLPVTIRLLDPPLHEFLPTDHDDIETLARELGSTPAAITERVESLREFNPMLGNRGCRLGITMPEIYGMQVQAIMEAACELTRDEGVKVYPEIEVPLVAHVNELRHVRMVIERVAEEVIARTGVRIPYKVGTMIELPRAAITADQIAKYADFFSFGTNDLTQTTFGISRDDAGSFLRPYVEKHILMQDPFVSIDIEGVGEIMKIAVSKARATKNDLEIGICGEHGGEPASVAFCHNLGLHYVSCSPYRVPIARLAAAHAALTDGKGVSLDA